MRTRIVMTISMLAIISCGCGDRPVRDDANAGMHDGWRLFRLGEFGDAEDVFADLVAAGGETRAEALYGLASVANHRRPGADLDAAWKLYERVLREHPESDMAPWSAFALARLKHLALWTTETASASGRAEAIAAYDDVIARYPGHRAAQEAFIYIQTNRIVSGDDEAIRVALKALEAYVATPESEPFRAMAYHMLSDCYERLAMPQARVDAKAMAVETAEENPATATELTQALYTWLVACYAEFEAGDFDTARTYYRRLIVEYPDDARVLAAEQALARMDATEAAVREEMVAAGRVGS